MSEFSEIDIIKELDAFYEDNMEEDLGYGEIMGTSHGVGGYTFLVEVNFPFHDEMKKYKEDMINFFEYEKIRTNGWEKQDYNFAYQNLEFADFMYDKYYNILNKIFHLGFDDRWENYSMNLPNLYIQTPEKSVNLLHNHIHCGGSVSSVCYVDLPKEGGNLEFSYGDSVHVIDVSINSLYLFPSWIYHRPLSHEEDITRVTINTDFMSTARPQLKLDGSLW